MLLTDGDVGADDLETAIYHHRNHHAYSHSDRGN